MKQYFSFQWHITDECDQRCKHCYIFSEDNCKKLESMNWEQMQEVFYNCLDFCKVYDRIPYFYITGGDPILHKDFWKLLGLMKGHKILFTILGNPFHLTDEVCKKLKECGCEKYQLSIDGMRETHTVFAEQPYLENVYPGETKTAGIIFQITDGEIEYFNLGERPIFRESYSFGNHGITQKGYHITDKCISCGTCSLVCPQKAIIQGTPYKIEQEHCLHCGNCEAHCPVNAVERY